jgi:cell volume regulation protein A
MGRLRSTAQISTSRPWDAADGDPSYPRRIDGVAVERQLLTRVDRAGALVSLEDGRYAFTGPIVAVGSTAGLQASARRRLAAATSEADRDWWREVIGALAR